MKKILGISLGALLLASSLGANAWWGDRWGNGYGYYDYYDNDWPIWTPMYWMEEMWDSWDDDYYDGYYGGYYGAPYGGGYSVPYVAPAYQAAAPVAQATAQ